MNYQQALEYIHGRPPGNSNRSGSPVELAIGGLLKALGDPQKDFKVIHIAGTNGKGSVAAMTAEALGLGGFKTGRFTSPYLQRFNERIAVDGCDISDDALAELTAEVKAAEDERERAGGSPLSEFEIVTAIGMLYFSRQGCEYAVLEVGLGGLYDPTNVIPPPEVAVITHIALDHTAILGSTIGEIAAQKAGIIKAGSRVVLAPNDPEAMAVLEGVCREKGIAPIKAELSKLSDISLTPKGCDYTYKGQNIRTGLLGRHQIANSLTAYLALCQISELSQETILQALAAAKWPGRLEILQQSPLTILDCAHNPDGAAALAEALTELFPDKKAVAVMGMMKDKDWKKCLEIIAPHCRKIFATAVSLPRALDPAELVKAAESRCPGVACKSPAEAVSLALAETQNDELLLICGSVILAGEIRQIFP